MTTLRSVFGSLCCLAFFACPPSPTTDGGTGGGAGGGGGTSSGVDAGPNPLPEVFTSAYGRAVAVHNGLIYVAGNGIRAGTTTNNDLLVARFRPDGTRDPAFGTDGVAVAAFDGGNELVPTDNDYAFALGFVGDQPVVAGSVRAFTPGSGDLGLARFTATGQLDTTFGTGGLRDGRFGAAAGLNALAVLSDNRLIVGGTLANGSRNQDMVMLRYDATGALDTTYTLTGVGAGAVVDCGFNNSEFVQNLIPQGDRFVAAGGNGFCAMRFTNTGALDLTFGTVGTGTLTMGNGTLAAMVQRSDGTLWGVGYVELNADGGPGTERFWLKQVRLSPEGVPVPDFGSNGRRQDLLSKFGGIRGAALQNDGKLLVYFAHLLRGHLLRLNPDGSLDTSFGTGGFLELDITFPLFEGGLDSANHLVIDGSTAWVTDINLVPLNANDVQQRLALVKVAL